MFQLRKGRFFTKEKLLEEVKRGIKPPQEKFSFLLVVKYGFTEAQN